MSLPVPVEVHYSWHSVPYEEGEEPEDAVRVLAVPFAEELQLENKLN